MAIASESTRDELPLILIRGFGGLEIEDERRSAYQGFNDGTVYPQKRGENFIYEGLVLRFLKSNWSYQDATNVLGYYCPSIRSRPAGDPGFDKTPPGVLHGDQWSWILGCAWACEGGRRCATLWVFRYYDLNDRSSPTTAARSSA